MYKLLEHKLEDINQQLPETEFIAVFGTSHTSGYCERNGETELVLDDFWAERLSKYTGLPVVNLSLIGNNNTTMGHQLAEFLLLDRSSNCVQVICETRVGEHVFVISNDTVEDFDDFERKNFLPQLSNVFALKNIENFDGLYKKFPKDTIHDLLQLRAPVTLLKLSKKDQINYIQKSHPGELDDVPNYVFKSIREQIENYDNHVRHTMRPFIEDYNCIKMMSQLCKLRNISFNWFCWDKNYLRDRRDTNYDVVHRAFRLTSDVFDREVSGLSGSVMDHFEKTIDETKLKEYKCDCGHWDERVHDYVAKNISEALDDER